MTRKQDKPRKDDQPQPLDEGTGPPPPPPPPPPQNDDPIGGG